MNAQNDNRSSRHALWRILDWIDYVIAVVLCLAVLIVCFITWWLTPARLSELVDRKASEGLNADVRTGDISFTFWSTFPHFCIVADSLHIRSRNLDSLPADVKAKLPEDPGFLISTGKIEGDINVARLLRGQIWLRDVAVDSMKLNLVAVDDSLNNYNLVPSSGKSKIPYFNIDKLKFVDGGEVRYFSLLSNTDARVKLTAASLMPNKKENDYHLMFRGNLFARTDGFALLRNFPFELDGDVQFRFKPFGISARDYTVNFGQVKGKVGLDLDLGNDVKLNNFDYRLSDFSLADLRMILPDVDRDLLKKFDADLELQATARLTSPYNFSSGLFPSVEVDFRVPDGNASYTFNDNEKYEVRNVGLIGRFVFDGKNPKLSYLDISDLHLNGMGADITASAHVSNFTEHPYIDFDMKGRGNLDEAARSVHALRDLGLSGSADFNVSTSFEMSGSTIRSTRLKADVNSDNLTVSAGGYDLSLQGLRASTADNFTDILSRNSNLVNLPFNIVVEADNAVVADNNNSRSYSADGLKAEAKISHGSTDGRPRRFGLRLSGRNASVDDRGKAIAYDIKDLVAEADVTDIQYGKGLPEIGLRLGGNKVHISDKNNHGVLNVANLKGDVKIHRGKKDGVADKIDVKLSGSDVNFNTTGLDGNLNNVSLDFSASQLNDPVSVPSFNAPASWSADRETMGRVSHTPEFVRVSIPVDVRDLMARWKVAFALKSSGGDLAVDKYDLKLSNLDLAASLDSITVRNAGIAHGSTRGDVQAKIYNLRQFINSPVPAPLMVDANVSLDTVQVNQLARDFTRSHPNSAISRGDKEAMGAGVDTVAIILPRNIYANVHATAMQTRYTNLHLYDLMTNISMRDGAVNVDTLHISSDFGQLGLTASYNTSDLQDIKANAGVRFYDVDVVGFFNNFQKLLAMWPEMKNLSGTLSIGLDARAHVFPSMFINPASLWADAHIEGVGLQLHQNDFVRHLAHMMLIYQDAPIDIEDIKFHAVMHSNLLEVFPTTFEVSKYKLFLMGLNNFNGDLYYHVGVENWPLKIPFGVNITGNYRHPVMKFGGKDWKDRNGAMITGNVQDYNSFNLVHESRRYAGEFIHSAASYDE